MATGSNSSGFVVRISILLAVLLACAGIWSYDKYVRAPQITKKVEEFYKLTLTKLNDGGGLPKDVVHQKVGMSPVETFGVGSYEVEKYKVARTLPFMPGGAELYVVYKDKSLYGIEADRPTSERLDSRYKLDDGSGHKVNKDFMPQVAGAGGGGGGGGKKADDKEKSDDVKKDNADAKTEGDAAKTEEKKDDAAEKKDDAAEKSGESKDDAGKTEEKKDGGTEEKKDGGL